MRVCLRLWPAVVLVGGMLLCEEAASQQQRLGPPLPAPRVLLLMPSGGKAGSTVEVVITGQDLDEPQGLLFSQPGFKAELLGPVTGPTKLSPGTTRNQGMQQQAGASSTKFKVTIPSDVPLGMHDLRLVNKWGVSNPRAFTVGDLEEVLEKESNNDVEQAQRVPLNTTINGAIGAPTDVDYFVFTAKKGERVVISCLTSSIDSRLPAAIQLYDSERQLVGSNRHYQGSDALVDVTAPADGDYFVRLFGFTYSVGGLEYFYRLSITTAPWIDAVVPPMVEPGKPAKLTVYGRNLPGGKPDPDAVIDGRVLDKMTVTLTAPSEVQRLAYRGFVPPHASALDGFTYTLRNSAGTSNLYRLGYAQAPVVLDNDKNDTPETAQEVTLPCEIAGRIEKRRDRDWYTFTATKGDVYSVEAYGDRLGSSIDLYFAIRNADGKQVVESDDNPDILKPVQFFTRTEDPPRYRFQVSTTGKYQLQVASREAEIQAGPRDLYRVRIAPERPDFRMVVMPPSLYSPDAAVVGQGGEQFLTVLVWRLDGFEGDVALSIEGLPTGVSCPPQTVAGGWRQAALVIGAAADAPPWTGEIKVKGTATIAGQTVVRAARPATISWPIPVQQNTTTISRLDQNLVLAVRDKSAYRLSVTLDKPAVFGADKVTVSVKASRLWPDAKVPIQLTLINMPPTLLYGNRNQPVVLPGDKDDFSSTLDIPNTVAPGTYNLVLLGQAQIPFAKDPAGKQKSVSTVMLPSLPVVLTVLPRQVATLTATPGNVTLKPGTQTEVVIKVSRQYNYAGDFKVQLVVPPNTKGIRADEATIPAGKDEVKLLLHAAGDAATGKNINLVVQAIAKINGTAITQETKYTVNVAK